MVHSQARETCQATCQGTGSSGSCMQHALKHTARTHTHRARQTHCRHCFQASNSIRGQGRCRTCRACLVALRGHVPIGRRAQARARRLARACFSAGVRWWRAVGLGAHASEVCRLREITPPYAKPLHLTHAHAHVHAGTPARPHPHPRT